MTQSDDLFLLLCWLTALLALLFLGALWTDAVLPAIRRRQQARRLAYLNTMADWPSWCRRQAD